MTHWLTRFLFRAVRYLLAKGRALEAALLRRMPTHHLAQTTICRSTSYDMMAQPDEPYYSKEYLSWILPALEANSPDLTAGILDLGCGQGRLLIPLAEKFPYARMTGIDFSPSAIESARRYAEARELRNIEFRCTPIPEAVQDFSPETFRGILMTEVTFYFPDWEHEIARIRDLLTPGGWLFVAFRPQYYNALQIVKDRRWEAVDLLLERRRGHILGGPVEYSWMTSQEIHDRFTNKFGMDVIRIVGIGCCSGIPGDPHAVLAEPSHLPVEDLPYLERLEAWFGRQIPDAGRYMLLITRKRGEDPSFPPVKFPLN